MKVLILGGGGREHAIAWKLRKDDPGIELLAGPGNPGIRRLGRCVPIDASDPDSVLALASNERPDLVVIGPEAPLVAGVSDVLRSAGHPVFGPSRAASQIEASKRFSKELMLRASVPTAAASWHSDPQSAKRAAHARGAPVVIKASGLAGGKGVIVAMTLAEAEHAIDSMMLHGVFGSSGSEVLVEEFMDGEELSVFAVTDGEHYVLLPAAQDHKRLFDGDTGPNTGGMGAYAPASIGDASLLEKVRSRIIGPTLAAMRDAGARFSGLLYAGLMLTPTGPRVVEFNCRFGDPETQAVLPILGASLLPTLMGASRAGGLEGAHDPPAAGIVAVTTVVAAPGYPDAPILGTEVVLPPDTAQMLVFHAGVRDLSTGLVSSGGRVVSVTGLGGSITDAHRESLRGAEQIQLAGAQFRRDISWREQQRFARAT